MFEQGKSLKFNFSDSDFAAVLDQSGLSVRCREEEKKENMAKLVFTDGLSCTGKEVFIIC